jgi:multicomponent Na+:H+ antiporter subunit D
MPLPDAFGIQALTGGVFHMINDVLDLGLIFLATGGIIYMTRKEDINEVSGLAHRSTFLTVMFLVGLLAISGMPPMNGFASKLLIYESVYYLNPLLAITGILGSIMMLAVFVKLFASVFLGNPYKGAVRKLPKTMAFVMLVFAITIILFGLFPGTVIDTLVTPAVEALINMPGYIGGII